MNENIFIFFTILNKYSTLIYTHIYSLFHCPNFLYVVLSYSYLCMCESMLLFLCLQEIDDPTLRRFLRARDLDVEKASGMFIKYLTWRRSFVPKGSITLSEITNQIADNKIFMQGKDKKGCPVSVILGARHFPSKQGTDELKRPYMRINNFSLTRKK